VIGSGESATILTKVWGPLSDVHALGTLFLMPTPSFLTVLFKGCVVVYQASPLELGFDEVPEEFSKGLASTTLQQKDVEE
jgi:hypothetical protein